jgi:hypothetical protein
MDNKQRDKLFNLSPTHRITFVVLTSCNVKRHITTCQNQRLSRMANDLSKCKYFKAG